MLASGNKPWTRAIKRTISWCAPLSCYIATLFCNHGQHVHTSLARTPRSSQLVSCESHQLVSSRKGMWRPSRDTLSRLDDHSGTKSNTQHIPNSALTKDHYKIISFITHNEANQFWHMDHWNSGGERGSVLMGHSRMSRSRLYMSLTFLSASAMDSGESRTRFSLTAAAAMAALLTHCNMNMHTKNNTLHRSYKHITQMYYSGTGTEKILKAQGDHSVGLESLDGIMPCTSNSF